MAALALQSHNRISTPSHYPSRSCGKFPLSYNQPRLLLAGKPAARCQRIELLLNRSGYLAQRCTYAGDEVLCQLHSSRVIAVIVDLTLAGDNPAQAVYDVREIRPDVPIVALYSPCQERHADGLLAAGVHWCMQLPVTTADLLEVPLRAMRAMTKH